MFSHLFISVLLDDLESKQLFLMYVRLVILNAIACRYNALVQYTSDECNGFVLLCVVGIKVAFSLNVILKVKPAAWPSG